MSPPGELQNGKPLSSPPTVYNKQIKVPDNDRVRSPTYSAKRNALALAPSLSVTFLHEVHLFELIDVLEYHRLFLPPLELR